MFSSFSSARQMKNKVTTLFLSFSQSGGGRSGAAGRGGGGERSVPGKQQFLFGRSSKRSFSSSASSSSSSSSATTSSTTTSSGSTSSGSTSSGTRSGTGSAAAAAAAAPAPLSRNVAFIEAVKPRWVVESPNYKRIPFWRQYWEAQFANRSFFFFGNAWTSAVSFALFLWWSRLFDPPPKERLDRYWLNSPKFRILSAFHNPGKRPAVKISLMTFETRYFFRGMDHPFSLNEVKDFWWKIKENFLIAKFPKVQYPFVFRNFNRISSPGTLEVHTYPTPQKAPHFEGEH